VRFPGGDLEVERRDDGEVLLTGDAERAIEGTAHVEGSSDRGDLRVTRRDRRRGSGSPRGPVR
jgi:hypothetical protein